MAEFIFKDLLEKRGLSAEYYVRSSATSTEEIQNGIGNPVYPPAREELKKHGISCVGKRAVQLTAADYAKYDLLIAMDSNNIRNMMRIFHSDPDGKIHKLSEFADSQNDISDPWYTRDFETCFCDIYKGCSCLLNCLLKGETENA